MCESSVGGGSLHLEYGLDGEAIVLRGKRRIGFL